MFDMRGEITLNLHSPEGTKKIVIRYPSDNEFIEWRRKKRDFYRDLGRGKTVDEPDKPEPCDLALASSLRIDKEGGPSLDEAESLQIIRRICAAEVTEIPEREGVNYVIRMKIVKGMSTTHTLRVPSVRELMDYERQHISVINERFGRKEMKLNFRASVEFYDKLKQSAEGYVSDIPAAHKSLAVAILQQQLRLDQEEAPDSDDDQD